MRIITTEVMKDKHGFAQELCGCAVGCAEGLWPSAMSHWILGDAQQLGRSPEFFFKGWTEAQSASAHQAA
jgi:hypothetical protein